jgi:WD40 repeat protein
LQSHPTAPISPLVAMTKVYFFSKDSSTPLWSYKASGNVKSVAISSDGSYIAAGGDDQSLLLLKG